MNCPRCGRPVSGHAQVCGYCGKTLTTSSMADWGEVSEGKPPESPARRAAFLLGILGGIALLGGLAGQLAVFLKNAGFSITLPWIIRTLMFSLVPTIYLGRLFALKLRPEGLFGDCLFLMLFSGGLAAVCLWYLNQGSAAFYGFVWMPYCLTGGFSFCIIAQLFRVLAVRN